MVFIDFGKIYDRVLETKYVSNNYIDVINDICNSIITNMLRLRNVSNEISINNIRLYKDRFYILSSSYLNPNGTMIRDIKIQLIIYL